MRRIAVAADSYDNAKILFAAICQSTVNNYIKVDGDIVHFDMLEVGNEVLLGAELLSGVLKTSRAADNYSLFAALQDPQTIPDGEMKLSIRYADNYCGRVHFGYIDSISKLLKLKADAVIILARDEISIAQNDIMRRCVKMGIPFTVALIPDSWKQCKNCSPNVLFEKSVSDKTIHDNVRYLGWYDPYGFNNGERLDAESSKPYGVLALFWNSLRAAVQYSFANLRNEMSKSQRSIMSRASVFQRGSPRRVIELENARRDYARCATKIITTENLYELVNLYFV